MNETPASSRFSAALGPLLQLADRSAQLLARSPVSLTQLVLRFALAVPFFKSGLTKWDGFLRLSDSVIFLFTEEFRLHVFGSQYTFPFPQVVAFLSAAGEIVLPVLLVLGLGTRFAALGILIMTALIQITVPDGWANFHLPWAAMALALITYGPGRFALDGLIASRWRPTPPGRKSN